MVRTKGKSQSTSHGALHRTHYIIMVIVIDVDMFFKRNDFIKYYKAKVRWPWRSTHFILRKNCIACGFTTNNENSSLNHFVLPMKRVDLLMLANSSIFWCSVCHYAIYDHYPEDECLFCN